MAIANHHIQSARRIEAQVRERPNGGRVLRLLRETQYLDGRLGSSLLTAERFPLLTAALTAGVALLAFGFTK